MGKRIIQAAAGITLVLLSASCTGAAGAADTHASATVASPPTAYVVADGPGQGWTTPINTATSIPGPPVKVGSPAVAVAITPNGRTVYVITQGAAGPEVVTPISTATNTAGPPIKVTGHPQAIAITP